jgi:hypothetical protein
MQVRGHCVGRFGVVSMHVLLKWAFVAECVMSGSQFLREEAVEASWQTVTGDGGMVLSAVAQVVFRLEVSAFAADATAFVGCWVVGAGVDVVGEEEASCALSMLYVECGEFNCAGLAIHIA